MIRALYEVIKDLWVFLVDALPFTGKRSLPVPKLSIPTVKETKDKQQEPLFAGNLISPQEFGKIAGRTAYVRLDRSICLQRPEMEFDLKVGELSYGERVEVTHTKDGFAHIKTNTLSGWVDEKDLSDDDKKIYPQLKSGQVYDEKHKETIKLRRCLKDETLAGELKLPLQAIEFLLYTLKSSGTRLAWPDKRPREAGDLQNLLRGVKGVKMGIEPRTSALLEYMGNEEKGFVGFVEAVHPDQSITLKSVGRVKEGEYLVENFSREEWKEWRPVFIAFT